MSKTSISAILIVLATVLGYTTYTFSQNSAQNLVDKDPLLESFQQWQKKHQKQYGSIEQNERFAIYKDNYQMIKEHNEKNASFSLGENAFMDLTFDEFQAQYTGFTKLSGKNGEIFLNNESIAESIDWREKGAVSPVKNQGQCGSCWAFSAVGAMEGLNAIKSGTLVQFAEQILVDCAKNGSQGCSGGWMDNAFDWVKDNGIAKESDYAYTGRDGACKTFKSAFKTGGFFDVPANNVEQMKAALNVGPVSVAIAVTRDFQFYREGVYDFKCPTTLNHGVLAVGYGTDKESGKDFWIVKNSWSTSWGEDGYIRFVKTDNNDAGICGILTHASYPLPAAAQIEQVA